MREMRAISLSGYLDVAAQVGLDGYLMLRRARIDPAALDDPEQRLPAEAVTGLIEDSARRSNCESFGLMMAERRTFSSVGPITLLLDRVATVREVIEASIEYRRHFNDVVSLALEENDGTAVIKVGLTPGYERRQSIDVVMAMAFRILVDASGARWKPSSVHSTHKAPQDLTVWNRYYSAPLQFDSTFNGFVCSSLSLDITLPHADAALAEHARGMLDLVPLTEEVAGVSDRTRRAIALLLPRGKARLQDTARHLSLGPRALQRALGKEGFTYAELLIAVRRELAADFLLRSSQPVTDISALLGYSSPSAFTRWFAAEFGLSPQAWRAERQSMQTMPPAYWKV